MSDDKTGGPAFPNNFSLPENQGLTIRDYFATQAMIAIFNERSLLFEGLTYEQALAHKAYEMADAMLAHRAKK